MRIDLNCDLGEAFGNYSFGGDNQIIPLITSLILLVASMLAMKMSCMTQLNLLRIMV